MYLCELIEREPEEEERVSSNMWRIYLENKKKKGGGESWFLLPGGQALSYVDTKRASLPFNQIQAPLAVILNTAPNNNATRRIYVFTAYQHLINRVGIKKKYNYFLKV